MHHKKINRFLFLGLGIFVFVFFAGCQNIVQNAKAASPSTSVVWLSDQNPNTILEALPISKQGSVQSPFVVYDAASEQETINFIAQLSPAATQVRVVETTAMTVPATFLNAISTQTGVSVVRSEPIDEYVFNYWKGKAGAPRYVVVADQESFMPYATVWAHRQASAFVNTYAEAERLVKNDSDITKIVYFGTSATMQTSLASLASANGKTIQQVTSLDEAMTMLTPARLAGTQSIVTFIHSNDTSSLTSSQQYWKIAPIYAAFRNTMLVTVGGSTVADVDASIDAKLNSIVVPNNGGADPGHLVVVGHWAVFPYRFSDPRFSYMLSADARYADRNNDGDYVPEIPFGRITAYDIGNAVLLMNKGLFFDSGAMKRGSKGVLASDWLVERETDTIAALQTMYGAANVYARGDIEFSNSLTNNPPLSEVLTQAKTAEVVILTGHGNPNYLAATNPAMTGQYIKNYKFYPPSFWWFNGCDTGSYYAYGTSLVSGALASGAVNIMATVDTTVVHSSALRWYPGFLAQGNDIGTMIQLGLKNCESYYGTNLNVNKLPQVYLIGDPLVNYPPSGASPLNKPPSTPAIPTGPTKGMTSIEYTYSTSTTDPDSTQLTFTFDWGDGKTSTAGPVDSGETVSTSHSWANPGTYAVKAMVVDQAVDPSEWSSPLSVVITLSDVDDVTPTPTPTATPIPQVTVQGRHVNSAGVDFSITGQKVTLNTGISKLESPTWWFNALSPNKYTATSSAIAGYNISYSLCVNCTNHTSYTLGNSTTFELPSGGNYADIYFKYIPIPTPTPTPIPTSTPTPTKTPTLTPTPTKASTPTPTRTPTPTPTKMPTPIPTRTPVPTLIPTKTPTPTPTRTPTPTPTPVSTVTIQGHHVSSTGADFSLAGQKITLNTNISTTRAPTWWFNGLSTNTYYKVTATKIAGYNISYSLCVNCTSHAKYVSGNSITLKFLHGGSYADIYFKYTPIPTSTPIPPTSTPTPAPITSCIDSDNGSLYKKGTATGTMFSGELKNNVSDSCTSLGEKTYLNEWVCDTNTSKLYSFLSTCLYGCQEGACLCPTPYHTLSPQGSCLWSCGAGTAPSTTTHECVCLTGYTETGKDSYGRRICSQMSQ